MCDYRIDHLLDHRVFRWQETEYLYGGWTRNYPFLLVLQIITDFPGK